MQQKPDYVPQFSLIASNKPQFATIVKISHDQSYSQVSAYFRKIPGWNGSFTAPPAFEQPLSQRSIEALAHEIGMYIVDFVESGNNYPYDRRCL